MIQKQNRRKVEHSLIEVERVSKSFPGNPPKKALKSMSFSIPEGKITAIIGESGSGKSTLLKLIYGLLPVDSGAVYMDGSPVPDPRMVLIPGHPSMRLVSQGFDDLVTYASVWDNVSAQLTNTDLPAKRRKTQQALKRLRIDHLKAQRVVDLSGGEKQRVAIATALVSEPRVLLLDEPFNQVDAAFRDTLQDDIREIVRSLGVTVLLVSHDPSEVLSLADQLLVLKSGHLLAKGDPRTLFEQAPNAYTAKLLARANVLSSEEAGLLGIFSEKSIGIHLYELELNRNPEHHRPHKAVPNRLQGKVEAVYFKGLHTELSVHISGVRLRVCVSRDQVWELGESVGVQILSYWQLSK